MLSGLSPSCEAIYSDIKPIPRRYPPGIYAKLLTVDKVRPDHRPLRHHLLASAIRSPCNEECLHRLRGNAVTSNIPLSELLQHWLLWAPSRSIIPPGVLTSVAAEIRSRRRCDRGGRRGVRPYAPKERARMSKNAGLSVVYDRSIHRNHRPRPVWVRLRRQSETRHRPAPISPTGRHVRAVNE